MKIKITYKNKKFDISDVRKVSELGKIKGLMFTPREKAQALLFQFKNPTKQPIHSFFVGFPFFAIWLNSEDKIREIQKINPWNPSIKPKKPYTKLIEIPCNSKYTSTTKFLDDNERFKNKNTVR